MRHAYRARAGEVEIRRYRAAAPPAHGGAPAGGPAGNAPAGQVPELAPWPFPVGVFSTEVQNPYDQTVTATTGALQFPDVQVEPDGWVAGLWFDFNLVAVNATTNTVAVAEDFPFLAVNTVLLKGTNVPQTFGPFGGYDWQNIDKFGGYEEIGDPRNDNGYSVTTGTATTAGSAHWLLYMPMQISRHDALGSLQNQSDNSVYRVAVTLESTSVMYTTAPTGAVTCEMTVEQDSYSEPVAALALSGRPMMDAPPLPGTRQCWQIEDDASIPASSNHTTKITNGIGYAFRNEICRFKRAGTSRANGESDFPDPMEFWLGGTRIKRMKQTVMKAKLTRRFGFTSTTADSANGPENGVRVLMWDRDVGMGPGNEARRTYLRTKDGNVWKVVGTWGHAGTLWLLSNYVIPRGGPANNSNIVA